MADALCGPSNPLQNFQKHSSVDRSLQQDRIVSRQAPSQGFRSEPGPNAGILDPEFEAFQAGHHAHLGPPDLIHQHQQGLWQSPAPQRHHQPGAAGWASDFQNLHISQPPHAPQPQLAQHPAPSPWYQDFQRQQQTPVSQQQAFQSAYQPQFSSIAPFNVQRPMTYNPIASNADYSESRWKGKERAWTENEEETAAFDREFEALASEALRQETEQNDAVSTELGNLGSFAKMRERTEFERIQQELELVPQDSLPAETDVLNERMETIHEENNARQTDDFRPQHTDDDLANTAAELLDRVSDNTTQKFQESSFLALMRRLRDREVRVEGEQMVDVEDGKPISGQNLEKAPIIPPAEQDDDRGRGANYTMVGALPPDDDGSYAHGLDDGYGIQSTDPATLYGMHPVDDF